MNWEIIEYAVVAIIVLACAAYAWRRLLKTARGQGSACEFCHCAQMDKKNGATCDAVKRENCPDAKKETPKAEESDHG